MKLLIILSLLLSINLISQELRIKSNTFSSDEKEGISIFKGDVNIIKGNDELNASMVVIHTDKNHEPTKFVATGDASFVIKTLEGSTYSGKAQKVIYLPFEKEYHFYKNVHLRQLDDKKEIIGEQVVLKTIEGKAYAKGAKKEPVIMIFKLPEEKKE